MNSTVSRLSGPQKAGVLMISLGAEESAKVFGCLTPEERDLLGTEIVKLRHVDELTRRSVLEEVNDIIVRYHTVPETGEPAAAEGRLDSNEPFKWVESLPPDEVVRMIGHERPQNIALILAHIAPQAAARILSRLSESVRNQVAHRLATMNPVTREAIEATDAAMRQKAGKVNARRRHEGILGILEGATERVKDSVGNALTIFEAVSQPISVRTFASPDDMLQLSDAEMRSVLAEVDFDDLCLALRVAGDKLRSAVLANAPEEIGPALHREINSTAQIRVREIERAQTRIVEALNSLFVGDRALEAAVE